MGTRGRAELSSARPPVGHRWTTSRRRKVTALAMLAPALIGLLFFFAYPLIANVYFSFTAYDLVSPPVWAGLRNYEYMFTKDPQLVKAVLNTLWLVAILVPVKLLSALCVAGLLKRVKRASGIFRTLFYLPALIPPVASIVAFVFIFNPGTGIVNSFLRWLGIDGPLWFNSAALAKPSLVLMAVWMMGDIMIIFLASLLDVPQEHREAAQLDGANGRQQVWYIVLPHLRPALIFAAIIGVIDALQYFTEAAVASTVANGKTGMGTQLGAILGYPDGSLLTYTIWLYVRGFSYFQLGYAAALSVVLLVVMAGLLLVLMRAFGAFKIEKG